MTPRSLFTASPFKPKGYAQAVVPIRRLGQDDLLDIFGDIIGADEINLSVVEDLLEEFDQLITAMPVGTLKDSYEKQREDCMEKSNLYSKYKCLYDLFQEVKRALKNGGDGKVPTPTRDPKPKENGFPWVPVGIAAGVGLAAVIYLIVRSKAAPANGKNKK